LGEFWILDFGFWILDLLQDGQKRGKSQPSNRKLLVEVITPEGYKITYTADDPEDLNVFRDQLIKQVGEG
jgi:CheY-like chemotaxis protein